MLVAAAAARKIDNMTLFDADERAQLPVPEIALFSIEGAVFSAILMTKHTVIGRARENACGSAWK